MEKIARYSKCLRPWMVMAFACLCMAQACKAKEPIRIGFVGGTFGRVADLGISGRDAAQLAVEHCNRDGGIRGRPVRLLIKDDQQDPEGARQAVRELIAERALAMVGPMTSDMAVAIVPLLNEARFLAVSPTATTEALSGRDDYFFRVTATTRAFAAKNARYHIKNGTMRRIAAVYDLNNRTFCENWLENFKAVFTASGGSVIATVSFDARGPQTFLSIAHQLLSHGPDGILIIANSMDSALLCQQIRKLDTSIPITLADWGATERLLELGGRAVEGVTVVQTFDRESPVPPYQAFREAYRARYQREPGFPGVHTYDAVQVVLTALKSQRKGADLKETVLSLARFQGLQGEFSFDPFGEVEQIHASISVVKNNKFVVLD